MSEREDRIWERYPRCGFPVTLLRFLACARRISGLRGPFYRAGMTTVLDFTVSWVM